MQMTTHPYYRAASGGHFEVIQTLSAYDVDFTRAASTGENALHFATMANRLLCIRMLAQRGVCCADVKYQSRMIPHLPPNESTPLIRTL